MTLKLIVFNKFGIFFIYFLLFLFFVWLFPSLTEVGWNIYSRDIQFPFVNSYATVSLQTANIMPLFLQSRAFGWYWFAIFFLFVKKRDLFTFLSVFSPQWEVQFVWWFKPSWRSKGRKGGNRFEAWSIFKVPLKWTEKWAICIWIEFCIWTEFWILTEIFFTYSHLISVPSVFIANDFNGIHMYSKGAYLKLLDFVDSQLIILRLWQNLVSKFFCKYMTLANF